MKKSLLLTLLFASIITTAGIAGFDGNFVLSSGDYDVVITGKHKYCITEILYKNYLTGNSNGYYGSILAPKNAKFIGSGHKEGGEEDVVSVDVYVDGKKQSIAQGAKFKGSKVVMKKVSILDNLKVFVDFTITKEGIRIDKNFEALDNQDVYSFYIFQFCWSEKTQDWMIGRPDGSTRAGKFKSNMGWHIRGEKEILWCALFDPHAEKGIIAYFASYYPLQGRYMLWDKTIYHKFYYWANLPKVIKKGTKSRKYTLILQGIDAERANWQKATKTAAEALEKKYPLPPLPDKLHFSFENESGTNAYEGKKCLEVKGNGAFKCKKLPVSLQKNSNYEITFAIRKSPETSQRSSDNFILVGQYDKKRKFHIFATYAANVSRDNKWHKVSGKFKTPDMVFDSNVYIYNKNTTAPIWIDELKIQKIK
jgi:hypothetical protein